MFRKENHNNPNISKQYEGYLNVLDNFVLIGDLQPIFYGIHYVEA